MIDKVPKLNGIYDGKLRFYRIVLRRFFVVSC